MLNMKNKSTGDVSIKPAMVKLIVGLLFIILAPNLMAGMFDVDVVLGCRYNYIYDTVREDELRSFFGFHFAPHDPNPVCVKYSENKPEGKNLSSKLECYVNGKPETCVKYNPDTDEGKNGNRAQTDFEPCNGECPQPQNPLNKVIAGVIWGIRIFTLVIAAVIFIGAGLPVLKYHLNY